MQFVFLAHLYCKVCFKPSKSFVLEGQSLKYSLNKLVTYILYYYAGPGCLIYCCKLCYFLYHVCHIHLCLASPEIAVVFFVESYKTVIERRSYVSLINIIELFDLPDSSF